MNRKVVCWEDIYPTSHVPNTVDGHGVRRLMDRFGYVKDASGKKWVRPGDKPRRKNKIKRGVVTGP